MKNMKWKFGVIALIVPATALFFCSPSLRAEGNSSRSVVEEMQAGETGSTEGGSPPGPFGDHWVHVQENAEVDSYDSRIGDYDESKSCGANVGSNVNPNDSQAGISLDNNSEVCGDVSVTTPQEEGDIQVAGQSEVTGSLNYSCPKWILLPISMPGWYTEAGGGPNGQIDGDYGSKPGEYEIENYNFHANNNAVVTFHAGEYHFVNFELFQNVDFQIDPEIGEDEKVEIYIENSILFENNSEFIPPIEFSGDTTKLSIYFDGTSKVDLSNNVEFYGFLYAPKARIEVKNNDEIYGNLVGKEVFLWNNAAVHYDKALLDENFGNIFTGGIPAQPHEREDWKEIIKTNE